MSSFKDKPLKKCHTDKRKMIDDLHHNLIKTMEEEEKNDYYLDNGLLLDQYYKDNISGKQITTNEGILNYFKNNEIEDKNEESTKKSLINEYMCNIDDTIINSKFQDISIDKCIECNGNLLFKNNESIIYCPSC